MKNLVIPLKKKWFDLIKNGQKGVEYRVVNDYWTKRLMDKDGSYRKFDKIIFTLGYPKSGDLSRRIVRMHFETSATIIVHEEFGNKPMAVFKIVFSYKEATL